jgi:hypothetical protein
MDASRDPLTNYAINVGSMLNSVIRINVFDYKKNIDTCNAPVRKHGRNAVLPILNV